MKNDIGMENVPLAINREVMLNGHYLGRYLHPNTIKQLEKVSFLNFSQDSRLVPEQITDLGRWRFLEGYLTMEEDFPAVTFKVWFNECFENGLLGTTKNCEGCVGSFVTWEAEDDFNIRVGFWVVDGEWKFWNGKKWVKKTPPMTCQIGQFRFNRRLYIQYETYGDVFLGPPKRLGEADMASIIRTRNEKNRMRRNK
jgi:hypothetical protein